LIVNSFITEAAFRKVGTKLDYAIKATDLTKRYNGFVAVDHINFEVKKGEIFGFLGPNGAGKTTTTRLLTGLIKPDEGRATIMGYDITTEPLQAKQVMGIAPEMSNAYVDLSAWNNLMLIGELYGIPKKQRSERAKTLLEKFNLFDRRNQHVRGFSKGMKQRVLLGMALINSPSMLFLDEPTSALDVESAKLIRDMVVELNKTGTTVFLTTHNMEEANMLCDRIAIINHGKIAAIDTPQMLKTKSRSLQSIEVSFDQAVNTDDLCVISCVKKAEKKGDKYKIYTDDPTETLNWVMDYAQSHHLRIITLNTLAPSLEDVFLELTRTKPQEMGKV
jgi:ABC-2 type transport system ATP-binding protein